MKKVLCLMGQLYNGKYELYDYLIKGYHFSPYNTLTTRKKSNLDRHNIFKTVSINTFIEAEANDDLVSITKFKEDSYGKRFSDIPMGFSVCITDYKEYQALSKRVDTVGILINQDIPTRYERNIDFNHYSPNEFLQHNEDTLDIYNQMIKDSSIIKISGTSLNQLKLEIDTFLKPYLNYLPRKIKIIPPQTKTI